MATPEPPPLLSPSPSPSPSPSVTGPRLSAWVPAVTAAVIALLQMVPEWPGRYLPDNDESYQLHAAVRLTQGLGFTFDGDDRLEDLARPQYTYMTSWPAPYGLLFALLIKVTGGLGPATVALRALKALAAFVGALGWLRLGGRFLNPLMTGVFALGLASMYFAPPANPSHLLVWSLMPWWLSSLLAGLATGSAALLLRAGMLAALAAGVRYSSIFLVPAGGLAVLLLGSGPVRRRLWGAFLAAAPAVAVFGALTLANWWFTGQAVRSDNQYSEWNFENLWRRRPLTFLFAFGFNLEEALYKLKPSWRFDVPFAAFLPWYGLFAAVALAAWRTGRLKWDGDSRRFAAAAALGAAVLVAFLAWVALRLPVNHHWNAVEGLRYYSEFVPALAIVWLMILAAVLTPPWKRPAAVGAAVVLAAAVGVGVRFAFRTTLTNVRTASSARSEAPPESPEAVIRARLAAMPGVPHVVIDSAIGSLKDLRWGGEVRTFPVDVPEMLPETASSESVYVIVVVRYKHGPGGGPGGEPQFDTDRALVWAEYFGLTVVDEARDAENWCQIYGRLVPAYRRGERPVRP